jgi:haloalkane dehalogenase
MEAPSEGSTRVGAATVHWRRQGSGRPLVLLHGFPLSGHTWDGVVEHLRDRFTCFAPDLIGLGGSSSTNEDDYSSPGQARAFAGLLSALGVDSYALVGNDTGGWIARELALVDQARTSRLVLTNTEIPFHRPPWVPMYQALARVPGFGPVMQTTLGFRAFRRSPMAFGGCFYDLDRLDGDFHTRYVEPLLTSADRLEGTFKFLRRMNFTRLDEFRELHASLTMPTAFIWGADDPTFPIARARDMAAQFPNAAGFHTIEKAKLFFYEEHPQEVAGLIGNFL